MKNLLNSILLTFVVCLFSQVNAQTCQPIATETTKSCKPSSDVATSISSACTSVSIAKATCQPKSGTTTAVSMETKKESGCQPAPACQQQNAKSTVSWASIFTAGIMKKNTTVQ